MTDINLTEPGSPAGNDRNGAKDNADLIELLFFAYRDFISDPDAILAEYGFGRAHHRVLHFVNRNPGLTVADLLGILKITKQSLARVLKQLVDSGFIEQKPGPNDRRQRLLYTTEDGRMLAERLIKPQSRRIDNALHGLGSAEREIVSRFLFEMIDRAEQAKVSRLTGKEQKD
ncbi:MAG TPA: MarR family transcriptional regulator [Afifellaceae bacterium]|nr:MarR family transcriptional regulator [Afifellaceae bacterium]